MQHTSEPRLVLRRLGWDDLREEAFAVHVAAGLVPARVSAQQRGACNVLTEEAELLADLAGRVHHESSGPLDLPAVGDWVALDVSADTAVVRALLERRTALVRKAAGRAVVEQVLAANVDAVLVVDSLDHDPNERRLERFLSAAWESGARPVVLLTKADLRQDAGEIAAEVASSTLVPVHAVSVRSGQGLDAVRACLAGDRTVALVGPSGAGKSTLVNHLLGDRRQATGDVRASDGRGRHTTTHRELFLVPGGGVVVDTPGLRELGLMGSPDSAGTGAFSDIDELEAACRFTDCAHESEPGCAVLAAIADGRLDPARLESRRKLDRELRSNAERHDPRAASERKRAYRRLERSFRKGSEGPWKS